MKNLKAFTLIELMVIVIIIGILSVLVIPAYRNYVEESKAKVCDTNLKALHSALEIYVMEQGSVPASLSFIPQEMLNRGYAKVMQNNKNKWKIELAYFVVDSADRKYVYAQVGNGSLLRLVKGNKNILICPADKRTDPNKISYAINKSIENYTKEQLASFTNFVIAEYDANINQTAFLFSPDNLAKRHRYYNSFGSRSFSEGIIWAGASVGANCNICKENCKNVYTKCVEFCYSGGTFSASCVNACENKFGTDGGKCILNNCINNFDSCTLL